MTLHPAELKETPVNCIHEITIRIPTDIGDMVFTFQTGAIEYTEMMEKAPEMIVDHKLLEAN